MNIIEKTYKWASSLSTRKSTKRIILHHAEASQCSADDIHSWHLARGWAGIGYHFFVRKDGSIYRGRPENKLGAHASNNNSDSIGICFEGAYMKETMPQVQINAGKELVAYLKNKYGISKVQRHKDVCSTDCPGVNFPFDEIAGASGTVSITVSNTSTSNNASNLYDSWVANLQTELNRQGFRDGSGNKLAVDGINGPKTLSACPTVKKGAKGNITKLIQQRLNSVGFSLTADGDFGTKTYNAVIVFQKNRGLTPDGIVGPKTWTWLLKGTKM